MQTRLLSLPVALLALTACATQVPSSTSAGSGGALQASPECQAARLKDPDPLPVSALPEDVLRKAQSGYVVVRYDVVAGRAGNATIVASEPRGLYDAFVLRHASAYTEPTGATVRGCIMTTNIKF